MPIALYNHIYQLLSQDICASSIITHRIQLVPSQIVTYKSLSMIKDLTDAKPTTQSVGSSILPCGIAAQVCTVWDGMRWHGKVWYVLRWQMNCSIQSHSAAV